MIKAYQGSSYYSNRNWRKSLDIVLNQTRQFGDDSIEMERLHDHVRRGSTAGKPVTSSLEMSNDIGKGERQTQPKNSSSTD